MTSDYGIFTLACCVHNLFYGKIYITKFFGMLMATVGTDMIGSVNFREVEDE